MTESEPAFIRFICGFTSLCTAKAQHLVSLARIVCRKERKKKEGEQHGHTRYPFGFFRFFRLCLIWLRPKAAPSPPYALWWLRSLQFPEDGFLPSIRASPRLDRGSRGTLRRNDRVGIRVHPVHLRFHFSPCPPWLRIKQVGVRCTPYRLLLLQTGARCPRHLGI
jgi:hypothetical protein